MDVVLQLVIFLVGRIAIFGQLHQQLRRPLAMLCSGAAVLIYQRGGDQAAKIFCRLGKLPEKLRKGL